LIHAVFSTKERVQIITPQLKPDLYSYMGGIFRELDAKPTIINGTADHVHCLFHLPADVPVSESMRVLKANSSKWVREHHSRKFAWQTGYAAFTVSASNRAPVFSYIKRQEEHHKKMSFQHELLMLLRKHGIEYDERYIWG
jgi:putative transposase